MKKERSSEKAESVDTSRETPHSRVREQILILTKTNQALQSSREVLEKDLREQNEILAKANRALQAEIVERQNAERQTRLLLKITQIISEAEDFQCAVGMALRMICEAIGWDYAEAWIPRDDGTALECSPDWCECNKRGQKFRSSSEGFTCAPGVGLPGRVWISRQPEWIPDLLLESENPLAHLAKESGLKTALGVPIVTDDRVLAVLVFLTSELRKENEKHVEIVSAIGKQLSSMLSHKEAKQMLQQRERLLQAMIDNSTRVIYLKDTQGRYLFINRQFERLFHLNRSEVRGKTDHDFFSKQVADAFRTNDLKALENKAPTEFEESVDQDDGIHIYLSNKFPLISFSGSAYAVCGISTDITEHKRMEEREVAGRQAAESWLRTLIETMQDAVVSTDPDSRISIFNPAAERMFGYTKREVIGQKVTILMPESYASDHHSYIERYEKTGEARAIGKIRTVAARRKNGEIFPIEISITKIPSAEDVRYSAFIRDISEKTKLRQQLIENERLANIGATAAKLAHEIGNPLNSMYITAQLLERRLSKKSVPSDESIISGVGSLRKELNRLHELLNEYRSLSRKERYNFQSTSLARLLAEILDMEGPYYMSVGVVIENDVPVDLPSIVGDGEKIKQVLLNLFRNAIEAMSAGGRLTIRGSSHYDKIVLDIDDTGPGVPPGIDIFEPFVTTKSSGTGLGLAIVRQIMAAHGGTIAYTSTPGKGTAFRLEFPLDSAAR